MTRTAALILALVCLSACTKESAKREQEYETMKRAHASSAKLCEKAGEVAKAYLAEGDAREYEIWDVTSDIDCQSARLDELR